MHLDKEPIVIGIDIGGTHIRIGSMTLDMDLLHFQKTKMKDVYDPNKPIESLQTFINDYLLDLNISNLIAIGIGFPSGISKDKTTIQSAPNLPGLDNINIVEPLEQIFSVPIFINKDVNMHLNYEMNRRNITKENTIVGCYIGTGFGNAIYLNGQFLEGKNGMAGEVGHIPIFKNGERCVCGNIGCIETLASGKRLAELRQKHFNDVPFEKLFELYHDHPIIEEFIECLAIPITTEINIFDPDYVILGGGVLQMKNFPKDKLEGHIKEHTRKPYPAQTLSIQYAESHQKTGVLGIGFYVWSHFKNEKPFKFASYENDLICNFLKI